MCINFDPPKLVRFNDSWYKSPVKPCIYSCQDDTQSAGLASASPKEPTWLSRWDWAWSIDGAQLNFMTWRWKISQCIYHISNQCISMSNSEKGRIQNWSEIHSLKGFRWVVVKCHRWESRFRAMGFEGHRSGLVDGVSSSVRMLGIFGYSLCLKFCLRKF